MNSARTRGEDAPAAAHDSAAAAASAGARQLPAEAAPAAQPPPPAALAASPGDSSVMCVTAAAWRTLPQWTTGAYTALGQATTLTLK